MKKKTTVKKNHNIIINNDLLIIKYCRTYFNISNNQLISYSVLDRTTHVTNTNVNEMKIRSIFGIGTVFTQKILSL